MSENEYIVEKILDKRIEDGIVEYYIKWEGYDDIESTWEPMENLDNIQNLIAEFEAENRKKGTHSTHKASRVSKPQAVAQIANELARSRLTEEFPDDQVPESISTVKADNDVMYAFVNWQAGSDGTSPESCFVKTSILADRYPKMLIAFYERKIRFVNKKN
jgi:hypothetical protein